MQGRDWGLFLLPYQQAVEELKIKFKSLRKELKAREEYSPIEFVTGRVKRVSSILDKARRLEVPLDRIETGIEDIAGIRIMCQFVEDIYRVAKMIRQRKDMIVVYEKDYIANSKESGYRSYHVIVEYPVQMSFAQVPILAEIQIRTLAMNFWATIEHSLNYKYKEQLPGPVKERLRAAAEAAFHLDTEMSSIRQEIVDAQKAFEDSASTVRKVLNAIQELFFMRRFREAAGYQLRFNELWEQEDIRGLKELSAELEELLGQLGKHEEGPEP